MGEATTTALKRSTDGSQMDTGRVSPRARVARATAASDDLTAEMLTGEIRNQMIIDDMVEHILLRNKFDEQIKVLRQR